jgi:selenocysteine lyase/cysteine desulfurase
MASAFPLKFARSHFPGLGQGWALFDNAGGSVALEGVAAAVADHLRHSAVQLGASYEGLSGRPGGCPHRR